jgi:hypothetical protein
MTATIMIDLSTGTIAATRIGTTIIGTATMASAATAAADHTRKGRGVEAQASATAATGRRALRVSGTLKANSSRRSRPAFFYNQMKPNYCRAKFCAANGSVRTRRPVAANSALATAGAIAGTPASPTPLGGRFVGTMWTSTRGMSAMRSTW